MKPGLSYAVVAVLSFFLFLTGMAQESNLYMQNEIKRAYDNDTRSWDGKPGPNYFQNQTDYKIDAEFDPYTRVLKGKETILFTNNSPDSLRRMIIRINSNILKKGVTRKKVLDPGDVTEGTNISHLKIGNNVIDMENNPPYLNENNLIIRLPEMIAPGSQTSVEVHWDYTFQANSNIREGRYHETTFFIAYWYPKIAVYDDIEGWDRHVYNAEQEFYHEYGDFEVNFTVPKDFYVWSSGMLQNANEVLTADKLELYERSKTSDKVLHILTKKDVDRGDLPKEQLAADLAF